MLYYQVVEPHTLDLIKRITAMPLPESFRLVGGTALALQFGHRRSHDIDLFSDQSFDSGEILGLISQKVDVSVVRQTKASANILVEGIKVDLVCIRHPWIREAIRSDGIIMAGPEDIACMKLLAITNRGRKRDFFDLFFLLKKIPFSELVELYKQKFRQYELFMLMQSLLYFDDAEEDAEPVLINEQITWAEVKEKMKSEVRNYHGD